MCAIFQGMASQNIPSCLRATTINLNRHNIPKTYVESIKINTACNCNINVMLNLFMGTNGKLTRTA